MMNETPNTDRVSEARALAMEIHHGQTDKGNNPYIYHVLDVVSRVAHLGPDYEIVGFLHDAVEDAPDHRPLTFAEIEQRFGPIVCAGVDAMTKQKTEDYHTDYLPRVASDPIGKVVKVADASHNISKAHLITDEALQKQLRAKYTEALEFLGADPIAAEVPLHFVRTANFTGWREDQT
jgi:(p)ppGpp synthase/HD superfamily hydrolase